MNRMFFSVEEILNEIFFDQIDENIKLLKKHKLYDVVEEHLVFLKSKKQSEIKEGFETLTVSFFQTINTTLKEIDDLEIRDDLKYVLSNIGNYIIDSVSLDKSELESLKEALVNLSKLKGYSFKDIDRYIQINRSIRKIEDNPLTKNKNNPYYEWKGDDYKLKEIADNLKSEDIIESVIPFKKLFAPEPNKIIINSEKGDFLFVLFDTMHDKGLIKSKIKRGKFVPLQEHCVDLYENILYEDKPKYIKQKIKKEKEKYHELIAKAKKWIE